MKNPLLLALLAATFFACADSPEARYEKMADGWCNCTATLVELNERAQKQMAAHDTTAAGQQEMANLFKEMESSEKNATSCSTILRDKYGAIKSSEWPAAEPFFWKKCPKMVGQSERLHAMLGE